MAYRKLAADNLFTGYEMLGSEAVLVLDPDGSVEGIIDIGDAGEGIERFSGVLSPGFVNCHCHLELSHLKGVIPEHSGMIEFLLSVMGKRNYSSEIIYEAIAAAEKEMTGNGIVAVGDICNTDHTVSQKKASGIYYHNFIEATGFIEATAPVRFEAAVDLYKKFSESGAASIAPHAPYSVSSLLFSLIDNFESSGLLTMHNQESAAENEFFTYAGGDFLKLYAALGLDVKHFRGTGSSSLVSSMEKLSSGHQLILVHNVLTDKSDLEHVKGRMDKLYWCLCPNANLYINNQLPDVNLLREYSENIVLGTDSLASNHQLNILSEIETLQRNFPGIEFAELLKWATINGARALRIEDRFGSFEKGKRPGVNCIKDGACHPVADEGGIRDL